MHLCINCGAMADKRLADHQDLVFVAELKDAQGVYSLYCCRACGINWTGRGAGPEWQELR